MPLIKNIEEKFCSSKEGYLIIATIILTVIILLGVVIYTAERPTFNCELDHVDSMRCAHMSDSMITCYPKHGSYDDGKQCRSKWIVEGIQNGKNKQISI